MKKLILISAIFLLTGFTVLPRVKSPVKYPVASNTLTAVEKIQGWKLLWDGQTTNGWRSAGKSTFPAKGWKIEDNALTIAPGNARDGLSGGDIVTVDEYSNFELVADFKITKGANSGIKYFVTESYTPTDPSVGLEFQVLDDAVHPDAKLGVRGNRTCGSLYDLIAALPNKKVNPVGEWNHARIIVKGSHVEHWLNGMKVVEYERTGQMFRALVNNSKFKDFEGFGEAQKGHILLQDHGNAVSYQNIKIRILK